MGKAEEVEPHFGANGPFISIYQLGPVGSVVCKVELLEIVPIPGQAQHQNDLAAGHNHHHQVPAAKILP